MKNQNLKIQPWGSATELERKRRIKISVWAYAYEFENDPMVSDDVFDQTCLEINPKIKTGKPKLDEFFKTEFDPFTGMWIHKHPELEGIKTIYEKYFAF